MEAKLDLAEIFDYYDGISVGLGVRFLLELRNSLNKIESNPLHTFNVDETFRRAIVKRFSYSIYYTVIENLVVVFAVLHQSRNSNTFFQRFPQH